MKAVLVEEDREQVEMGSQESKGSQVKRGMQGAGSAEGAKAAEGVPEAKPSDTASFMAIALGLFVPIFSYVCYWLFMDKNDPTRHRILQLNIRATIGAAVVLLLLFFVVLAGA